MVRAILLHAYRAQVGLGALRPPLRGRKRTKKAVPSPARGEQRNMRGVNNLGKYLVKRILHGIVSIVMVVILVMVLVYTLMERDKIFAGDSAYIKLGGNEKEAYRYSRWEEYGYLDYVPYADYLLELRVNGDIDEDTRAAAVGIGRTPEKDSELTAQYVAQFTRHYEEQGYTVVRLNAKLQGSRLAKGGQQQLFAYRDHPLIRRVIRYFTGLVTFDNIHRVEGDVGERGLTFTLHDPVYGGDTFAPAIIGNGTFHKYLLYFDGEFPYLHQNFATINLGTSYTVNRGVDVFDTMSQSQGPYALSTMTFPTGLTEDSADDLHTATYLAGSREANPVNADRFTDDYTNVATTKTGMSKTGYSFVIGIIATIGAYILGVPLGIVMARRKEGLVDKLGTFYIVFILAVPSLAYIFLFKAIGGRLGLPTTFDMSQINKLMFVLPIVSLALPSVANLMKWMRRYMIDQMNSDYVKFARSGGLTEGEIFTKHILKNAAIPIVHGIPGSIIFAMTGAIITERVYVVPGAGNLLTEAINKYDNGVIVGVTLFYAVLSVTSLILGDILMATVDPRISFSSKDR